MKADSPRILIVLFSALIAFSTFRAMAEDKGNSFPEYAKFEQIVKRNIFDPNRRAEKPVTRNIDQPEAPPEVEERILLIGTIITNRKNLALFESDKREYDTDAQVGTKLANFTVQSISTSGVHLVDGSRKLNLPVGAALERVNQGEWQVADEPTPTSITSDRPRESSFDRDRDKRDRRDRNDRNRSKDQNKNETDTISGASEASNSVLERMMERRKREMGQ